MIAGMNPELLPGRVVFAAFAPGAVPLEAAAAARASFAEAEGPSLILPVETAEALGLATDQPMRQITLTVFSALDGVGLTAAAAAALADEGIPANIVAATRHDHVFVPEARAKAALAALRALSERAASG